MKKTTSFSTFFTLIWILIVIATVSCRTSVDQDVPATTTVQLPTPSPTDIVSNVQEPELRPEATEPPLEEGEADRSSICPNLSSSRGAISWSPNGKYLAYTSSYGQINILSLDRSQSINDNVAVTPEFLDSASLPAWAPNSQRIAFTNLFKYRGLYLMDIRDNWQPGDANFPVVAVPRVAVVPQWFPDGERILLTLHERSSELSEDGYYLSEDVIAVYNLQTGVLNTLVETSAELDYDKLTSPHLSPDGNYVAYDVTDDVWDDYYGIYIIGVNGGQAVKISANDTCEAGPRWSPDGERIAFVSHRDGETLSDWNLFVMDKDGNNAVKLTNSWANDIYAPKQYVWSPDGKEILFVNHKRNTEKSIEIVNVATGEIATIMTEDEEICCFENPEWSPDGELVAYTFRNLADSSPYLSILDLESGETSILAEISDW